MMCRLTLQPHVDTPVHSHPARADDVDRTGPRSDSRSTATRESSGRVTSCTFRRTLRTARRMLDEEVVLIDIFTPIREEFLVP
jgi:hypothetical protein